MALYLGSNKVQLNSASHTNDTTITGETCTVQFPDNELLNEVTYLDGNFCTQTTRVAGTITVLKNSIIMLDTFLLGDGTFICTNQPMTVLKHPESTGANAYAAVIHGDCVLGYTSDAPQ